MKKILVPTDFSPNSKSGVRFAIHWATHQKTELIFIHVLNTMKPSTWTDDYFEKYAQNEENACYKKLKGFIGSIYKNLHIEPVKHSFIVLQGISPDLSILQYCLDKVDINYVCLSTRGSGKLGKLLGTNTGNLITKSPVPVMAVPSNYKIKPIKKILYAADLQNYSKELEKVLAFSHPFKTPIEILHFTWPNEIAFDEKTINLAFKKPYKYGIRIHFEKNDGIHSFIQNIQRQISVIKPSIVIMFTNQNRTIFQKIFLSNKSEELSFQIKIPLLVFSKD